METSWFGYADSVSYLLKRGSVEGYPDGTFKPQQIVNRAEFLKLVFRSRGDSEPVSDDCFADVPADAWFAPYVCAAKRRGIVQGYHAGSRSIFKPEQPINFAEAVKMTMRAYGNDVNEPSGETWYEPYVDALDRRKILRSSSYIPADQITRERAADLIARFVQHTEDRKIANLSEGCGKTERTPTGTITVGGQTRAYILDMPNAYSAHDPFPLIIAFHGRTNSNEQVRAYFGLDRAAADSFVAYPAGISNGNGSFSWSDPGDTSHTLRDIALFDALVKEVSESYCVDMDKIFVVGHSLGAWFANSLSCARGGVIRASATVGGSSVMNHCTGPTAALIINNPRDTLSSHSTAEAMRDLRIVTNICQTTTHQTEPSSLSCVTYTGCASNPVHWCPHTIDTDHRGVYYPHVWPPGVANSIVRFFDTL